MRPPRSKPRQMPPPSQELLNGNGKRTADSFHRELGKIVWDYCGMARNEAGLQKALSQIPALREEFWKNVRVLGANEEFNQSLERPAASPTSSSSPN